MGQLIIPNSDWNIDKDVLHSIVKSFADDTHVTKLIKTIEDVFRLQEDLQRIYQWTHDNNMKLMMSNLNYYAMAKMNVLKIKQTTPRHR